MPDSVRREKTFTIAADRLLFSGHNASVDGDIHIDMENTSGKAIFSSDLAVMDNKKVLLRNIYDLAGNEVIEFTSNKLKIKYANGIDFNSKPLINANIDSGTLDGISTLNMASGSSVSFAGASNGINFGNQTISNFNLPTSSLNPNSIASNNGFGSLEAELDANRTETLTALARTQAPHLTADRIVVGNGSGLLSSGGFSASTILRTGDATGQSFLGTKEFHGTLRFGNLQKISTVDGNVVYNQINFTDLAGNITTSQIPDLPTSKITSGTFDVARMDSRVVVRPSGNPSVASLVSVATNGAYSNKPHTDFVSGLLSDSPTITGTEAGVFEIKVLNDNTAHQPVFKLSRQNANGSSQSTTTFQQSSTALIVSSALIKLCGFQFTDSILKVGETSAQKIQFGASVNNITASRALVVNSSKEITTASTITTLTNGLSGTLADGFIPEFATSKITSGTFADARIPALATSKITSGTFADARIPALATSKITSGTFDDARIPALATSKITSGTFADARIPDLATSKITSGAFADARIPALATSKITSGTFDIARIPNLATSKITSGAFDVARIPSLATSKITSGTFADGFIPELATSKITSGTFDDARIPALATSKITSGTFADARIPNLGASKITSGVIADARLPTNILRTTISDQIITNGSTNGTILRIRHASNFQGDPALYIEDYNAMGSQLQAGIITLNADDVAIKNTDSDGGVSFFNNTSSFLGRLDNDGFNIKSGLTYKVDGTPIQILTTGSQTIQGVKTFPDQPIFVNGINASTSSTLGQAVGNHNHTIHGTVDLNATMTQTAGHESNLRTTLITGNLTQTGGNTSLTGNLTHTGGTVNITGDILLDGHMTIDTGHDIKILNDSVGIFSRVQSLEDNPRLKYIMGSTAVNTSLVMYCKFWSLPMNSGYALNDLIMGQGHTTTPQTKKYSNHYQTVFDGTVGTDMTDFTKTISSVSSPAYSVNINIAPSDWSPSGSTLLNVIINGTGYINWNDSSFPSNVRNKYNKLIRIGHYCDDAVKLTIDGQAIVWAKYGFSNSISGTGNDNFNSVCVVRGDISAIEIMYIGGGGGNYCNLSLNIMGAWD